MALILLQVVYVVVNPILPSKPLQQYEAQACTAKRLLYLASGIALDHEMEKNLTASGRSPGTACTMADGGGSLCNFWKYLRHFRMEMWCCGIA